MNHATEIETALARPDETPHINVAFPLQGARLPAEHGYALYAALAEKLPVIHGADWLGVELISGVPWDQGLIALPMRGACLRLRLPANQFGAVLPLAGQRLELAGHTIRLGIPLARPLQPAPSVYARIVTLKNHTEPDTFLEAARLKLTAPPPAGLGLASPFTLELPKDGATRHRRIVTIKGRKVVGFSVALHGLTDEDSLILQTLGLGGRRKMGCGIFVPIKGKQAEPYDLVAEGKSRDKERNV
jgi:CRISPR-associated endonuclease/helicase Cas3